MLLTLLIGMVVWVGAFRPANNQWISRDAKQLRESLLPAAHRKSDMEAILKNAMGSRNSVVFVYADWSLQAVISSYKYCDFARTWHRTQGTTPVLFHAINCTSIKRDFTVFRKLNGWSELVPPVRAASLSGYGSAIYIKDGKVVQVNDRLFDESSRQLIEETNWVFGL